MFDRIFGRWVRVCEVGVTATESILGHDLGDVDGLLIIDQNTKTKQYKATLKTSRSSQEIDPDWAIYSLKVKGAWPK